MITSLFVLLASQSIMLAPSDWPAWRGPASAGSSASGHLPTKWTPASAAWKFALPGRGTSTPIVWKDRIYVTCPAEGQDTLIALTREGKKIWTAGLGAESAPRHRTLASSCNPSPVTDGKAVYVRFRSGRLSAVSLEGKLLWQINLDEKFGPEQMFWDSGSSPVLSKDCVIVTRLHHGDSWIAGFDKKTGAQKWLVKRNYPCPTENDNGYATPVPITHKGKPAFLIWASDRLTAHSAEDGALLWWCEGFNPSGTGFWPAIASPVVVNDMVIVPVGRDDRGQARVHGIRLGGSGDVTQTHRAWVRNDTGVFCSTPVAHEGKAYLLRHRGGVVCLDPATGNTVWEDALPRSAASYYSSPLVAGGVLYAAREDGTVFAARVGEKFELLGENPMSERLIASPVPTAGGLLIRGEQNLTHIAGRDKSR